MAWIGGGDGSLERWVVVRLVLAEYESVSMVNEVSRGGMVGDTCRRLVGMQNEDFQLNPQSCGNVDGIVDSDRLVWCKPKAFAQGRRCALLAKPFTILAAH